MKPFPFILTLATLILAAPLHARPQFSVTTPEVRLKAAQDYLKNQPDQLAIYTKGFVCNSCGTGLRIHLTKISGVDKKRFKKGVLMDASKQLVVVAFQPKGEMNLDKIRDAIYRAGYEPAHYYKWNGKFVDIIEFQKAKKLDSKRPGKSRIKALAKTPRSKSKRSKRLGK